jgi:hypothetical protein
MSQNINAGIVPKGISRAQVAFKVRGEHYASSRQEKTAAEEAKAAAGPGLESLLFGAHQ